MYCHLKNDLISNYCFFSEWGNCDFENEDLCKWIIDPSPPGFPFNWERTNGLLLEEQNIEGPKHDHEEQNQSES